MAGFMRRKFTVKPVGSPNSDINVTPLVDVVLVLLIIFMVVTPLLEKDIEVRVPQTEEVETTSEVPPDQLVISIDKAGQISISTSVGLSERVPLEQYEQKIRDIMSTRKPDDKVAFFQVDDGANYGTFVNVLDRSKLAGVQILGMMTELPEAAAAPAPAPAP
ncbi:MAG: biopolymer transporter ExbD [Myxococcaceae bacterium]|nr:biopolymer transporter ExbD [Myxococcaceae bacterium]